MSGLLNFLQGASNAAASNVSAPVDGLAWLLKKAGVNVGTPVGGSDWMRQQGLTAEAPGLGGLLGESVGGVLPMVAAAKAPQIAAGLLKVGENAAARPMLNPQTGAIVWHGSPHKFDKFDSSKIGTGEGAQAYGHGLYLAESPDVAQDYAVNVSTAKRKIFDNSGLYVNGQKIDPLDPMSGIYSEIADKGPQRAIQDRLDDIQRLIQSKGEGHTLAKIKQRSLEKLRAILAKGEHVKRVTDVSVHQPEPLIYKVDLPDEKIARMLDWDAPLSKQSPEVQQALRQYMGPEWDKTWDSFQGVNAYDVLANGRHGNPSGNVAAAEKLRRAGIPGIRYLDGGSRGAGAGSSNFVVFPGEESALKILERNGSLIK